MRRGDIVRKLGTLRRLLLLRAHATWRIARLLSVPLAGAKGHDVLVILGDSHARVMAQAGRLGPFSYCAADAVRGVTMRGARPERFTFNRLPAVWWRRATAGVVLGEVDAASLRWLIDREETTEVYSSKAVARLDELVEAIRPRFAEVILIQMPPQIVDNYLGHEGSNPRRHIAATIGQRREVANAIDAAVERYALDRQIRYVRWVDHLTTPTGEVPREALPSDPFDHHLRPRPMHNAIAAALTSTR